MCGDDGALRPIPQRPRNDWHLRSHQLGAGHKCGGVGVWGVGVWVGVGVGVGGWGWVGGGGVGVFIDIYTHTLTGPLQFHELRAHQDAHVNKQ